jgi:hypothetical protein
MMREPERQLSSYNTPFPEDPDLVPSTHMEAIIAVLGN